MRVFVCSPLRGPDGLPAEKNKILARHLMRAVFDAGHAPFVPHLLYPQVLSESAPDLQAAFDANFAWLKVCEEIWVYAKDLASCSGGMKAEVMQAFEFLKRNWELATPRVYFMPEPFLAVERALVAENPPVAVGMCSKCYAVAEVNSQGLCMSCFTAGGVA